MKIAHFAPFAPGQAGLYETTRDMVKAERLAGHEVGLVDVGVDGKRKIGATDARGGCLIRTVDYADVEAFDLFVSHSGMLKGFLAKTGAPVVHILHGRPLSSFRLSQRDPKAPVYQLLSRWSQDARYAQFVTLWPEHLPYWRVFLPGDNLIAVEAPCDRERFPKEGPVHPFNPTGEFNVLIADLWRPDGDPYHIAHGMLDVKVPGLKAHFYGCNTKPGPWEYIWRAMRAKGILGETKGMMRNFDTVLRAADLVVTPHRIATRIVREALSVGTPVVAPMGSRHAQFSYLFPDCPQAIADTVDRAHETITRDPDAVDAMVEVSASKHRLEGFGKTITRIYQEVVESATVSA
jgi:glycosyltransferase involved in cell wall biosynthesis